MLAGKSIRNNILFALFILDHIRKRFNKFNPFGVSFVEICLAFQVLQRLMVGVNDEFFGPKIVLPNFQNSNQSKQLLIINRIVKTSVGGQTTSRVKVVANGC